MEQGRPIWVDDDRFDISYHVRLTALPKPGTWEQLLTDLTAAGVPCGPINGLDDAFALASSLELDPVVAVPGSVVPRLGAAFAAGEVDFRIVVAAVFAAAVALGLAHHKHRRESVLFEGVGDLQKPQDRPALVGTAAADRAGGGRAAGQDLGAAADDHDDQRHQHRVRP